MLAASAGQDNNQHCWASMPRMAARPRVCVLLDPGARPLFVQLLRFRTATRDFFLNQRPYHVQFFGAQYGLGAEVAGQTEADACC